MTDLPENTNIELAVRYHNAVADGATGASLAQFLHPDVVHQELPNLLSPQGATRDLAGILDAAERGSALLSAQRFDIHNAVAFGDQVALELTWTGTLAVPYGRLQVGDQLQADIATFLTIRDGVIIKQHNYDCYKPQS